MKNKFQKYQPFLFPILSIIWFLPTAHYGMVSDFIGWIYKYKAGSFADVVHCFHYNGLHQVFHFFNYSFYRIFDLHPIAWFVAFALLHGLNTQLVFLVIRKWRHRWNFDAPGIEWAVALLFLFSPYQIETVTWKACLHYLLSMISLMGGFILLVRYLENRTISRLLWIQALFFTSLFILEINLSAPFIFCTFLIADHIVMGTNRELKNSLLTVFLPMLGSIVIYFLLNKIVIGDWVGHYGMEEHLGASFSEIIGHAWLYLAKYLGFVHMMSFKLRTAIYEFIAEPQTTYVILLFFLGAFIYAIRSFRSLEMNVKISGLALVMFFMGLVPILSLYFYYITPYSNDRYSYYASPFFFLAIVALMYKLPTKIRILSIVLYLGFNMFLGLKMIKNIYMAADKHNATMANFPCDKVNGKDVYLLAIADNFKGHYFFGGYDDDATTFTKSLDLFYPDHNCNVKSWNNPVQYNMSNDVGGIKAHFESDTTIKVFIAQDATWFMRKGRGLSGYENDDYRVEPQGWYYLLHLKKKNPNAVYYVPFDSEWVEVLPSQ